MLCWISRDVPEPTPQEGGVVYGGVVDGGVVDGDSQCGDMVVFVGGGMSFSRRGGQSWAPLFTILSKQQPLARNIPSRGQYDMGGGSMARHSLGSVVLEPTSTLCSSSNLRQTPPQRVSPHTTKPPEPIHHHVHVGPHLLKLRLWGCCYCVKIPPSFLRRSI